MPNRINHNLPINSANQNVQQTHLLTKANEKHDSIKTASELTNTKLDTLSGAINNNLGDAQVKLQTYVYAHDGGNGQARPLQCDANGHLKVSNDVLEVSAETVNLNTDTLETKIQATNDKLDSFSGAGNNNIGEGQTKLQTYLYARDVAAGNFKPLVCDSDAHLQVDCLTSALPTGAATESTLSNVKTSVELLDDVVTAQNAAHPSKANAVGGRYYVDNTFRDIRVDNIGKVIVDSPSGSDINTRIDAISNAQTQNGDGTGNKPGVMLDAINTNIITSNTNLTSGNQIVKIMGSESGATDGTQRQVHVDGSGNLLTSIVSSVNILPANSLNSHITDDPANSISAGLKARTIQGTATSEQFLVCNSAGSLNVSQKKTYSSETSIVSSQSVSGSSTHTTSSITNDANIKEYLLEHNFSGSDVSYEIEESIDNSNFFNALGFVFNDPSSPTTANQGLLNAEIKSPFFRIKFTNGNASSRDVNLSFVSINH